MDTSYTNHLEGDLWDFAYSIDKTHESDEHYEIIDFLNASSRFRSFGNGFICTKCPDELNFDFTSSELGKASLFAKADVQFLPLTIYSMRWSIEVAYYEQKKFWSLGNYMLRSKIGIERLTNLLTLLYSFMTLLPFYDKTFSALSDNSPQQSRFVIGMTIWQELFFAAFEHGHISSKNALSFTCSHH